VLFGKCNCPLATSRVNADGDSGSEPFCFSERRSNNRVGVFTTIKMTMRINHA
jgi:hypothetical protein